jgi:hypothetical protein
MALIQINADLSRCAVALENIAHSLYWLLRSSADPKTKAALSRDGIPESRELPVYHALQTDKPRLSQPTDEDLYEIEQEDERRREAGTVEYSI